MRRACARMTALPGGGLVRAVIGIGTGHFPLEKGGESPPTSRPLIAFLPRPRSGFAAHASGKRGRIQT